MTRWLRRRKSLLSVSAVIAFLAIVILPFNSSSSVTLTSTAIESAEEDLDKDHCPSGIGEVPKDKHSYEVLVAICD